LVWCHIIKFYIDWIVCAIIVCMCCYHIPALPSAWNLTDNAGWFSLKFDAGAFINLILLQSYTFIIILEGRIHWWDAVGTIFIWKLSYQHCVKKVNNCCSSSLVQDSDSKVFFTQAYNCMFIFFVVLYVFNGYGHISFLTISYKGRFIYSGMK